MKNIKVFLSENVQFLEVKFSIYLNRRVFVMYQARQLYMAVTVSGSLQCLMSLKPGVVPLVVLGQVKLAIARLDIPGLRSEVQSYSECFALYP